MANITEVLKNTAKATVALAAASGLPLSIVALSQDRSHQADAPQVPNIEQPQPVDPRVDDLSDRVKKLETSPKVSDSGLSDKVKELEEEQEEHSLDIEFNQQQIDRNQGMIVALDRETKGIKENAFWIKTLREHLDKLNKKANKGKVDFHREKNEFLALFDKVKQFAHYGELDGFVSHMNEVTERFNEIEARLVKVENGNKAAQDLAMSAIREVKAIKSG